MQGLIRKAIAGFYYVEAGSAVYECKARGILRRKDQSPLVGDRVEMEVSGEGTGVVKEVLPRKNQFGRPPVANVDRLVVVSSTCEPKPNPLLMDRMIALAEDRGVEPLVVLTKQDLQSGEELAARYRLAGIPVFSVCCTTKEGVDALRDHLRGHITVFCGNTGVGKSSLLNALSPHLALPTGEISQKLGRGRHTTRHVELYPMEGGYWADTPGFSSLESLEGEFVHKDDLAFAFREFVPFLGQCRFTSCSHTGEKGCAIGRAVEEGKIHPGRYDSYVQLYEQAKAVKDWEIGKEGSR